jgi:hypothetical protein
MPQTVTVRKHATVTLALNDLATINLSLPDDSECYVKNTGPGKAWLSLDAGKPATVGDPNNLVLALGDSVIFKRLTRNTVLTANADTASTIITLVQNEGAF